MVKITFGEVPEFLEDLRKLVPRFRTLVDDLEVFKKAVMASPIKIRGLEPGQVHGSVRNSGLGSGVTTPIFKVKHFRCKALRAGSRSGFRIIYAYQKFADKIVYTFIEIYHKDDKKNEDRARILKYFG